MSFIRNGVMLVILMLLCFRKVFADVMRLLYFYIIG
ncbi:MAG: hypothetical protein IGNPGNKH_00453 [Sodalis sp. Ffu]|nr:MAG: hypothetical protein IGNPGNKH_00453 [Sodalis sp. Ffu]